MCALFIGIVAALVFGIVATAVFGQDGLITNAWVDVVFWSLIAAGAGVSAANIAWECLPCRLSQLAKTEAADRPAMP